MNSFFNLVSFILSGTGPIVIFLGTFPGLKELIEFSIGGELTVCGRTTFYSSYFALILLTGFWLQKKDFDSHMIRKKKTIGDYTALIENRKNTLISVMGGWYSQLVEWVLGHSKVTFYDVFKRPAYWENYDDSLYKEFPIFRLMIGNESVEVRFPKRKKGLVHVRKTENESHEYGDWNEVSIWDWGFLSVFAPLAFLKQALWK